MATAMTRQTDYNDHDDRTLAICRKKSRLALGKIGKIGKKQRNQLNGL
jgi:hypothetical protein